MRASKLVLVAAMIGALSGSAASAGRLRLDLRPPGPGNAQLGGAGNPVADGSFEAGAGAGNTNWVQTSTNFGTPLCDGGCGLAGARTGDFWAWFGGVDAFEEGAVSQIVTVPDGTSATLEFYLEIPSCAGVPEDFLEVLIDGVSVWAVDSQDAACGEVGYVLTQVSLDAQLDSTFELAFRSISGTDGTSSNFFLDDIGILVDDVPVELQEFGIE